MGLSIKQAGNEKSQAQLIVCRCAAIHQINQEHSDTQAGVQMGKGALGPLPALVANDTRATAER